MTYVKPHSKPLPADAVRVDGLDVELVVTDIRVRSDDRRLTDLVYARSKPVLTPVSGTPLQLERCFRGTRQWAPYYGDIVHVGDAVRVRLSGWILPRDRRQERFGTFRMFVETSSLLEERQ